MTVPIYTFFLVLQPDTEDLALHELKIWAKDSISKVSLTHGGIEFDAPLNIGLGLNYILKIPTRILMRIHGFKCKDFKRLSTKLTHTEWGQFASNGEVQWQISSKKSRVYVKKNIKQVAEAAYEKYRKAQPASIHEPHHKQSFYILINNDYCTISCDTTGELLHKRGYKTHSTVAPLRETTAATLIFKTLQSTKINPKEYSLIDPFCGSGTFLGEAAKLYKTNKKQRGFSFENFKILKKLKIEAQSDWPETTTFKDFYGFDKSDKAIAACEHNLKNIENVHLKNIDVLLDHKIESTKNIVITNPPYGLRVKSVSIKNALTKIATNYNPEFIAVYISQKQSLPKLENYKKIDEMCVKNTQISAKLHILQKNN